MKLSWAEQESLITSGLEWDSTISLSGSVYLVAPKAKT